MYYFLFEATPSLRHPETNEVGGAFVNCWIVANTLADAEIVARKTICDQNWIVDEPEEAFEVTRSFYDKESSSLQYYDQAVVDKEVYVFHSFPVEDR